MQEQIITPRHKGHLLTAFERGQIEALHRQVLSNRLIAQRIETINNELKRGLVRQVAKVNGKKVYRHEYSAEAALRSYEVARQCCHRHLKCLTVTAFLAWFVEQFKQHAWSPDAAVGYAKRPGLYATEEMVTASTLYNYIDDQRLEIRNIDLLEKTRRRTKHHQIARHKRAAGRGIEEWPKIVERRKQYGHWEMDTIVGKRKGKESVILTLIERKTRCQILRLIDGRDADSVEYALHEIQRTYGDVFKTIIVDNGPGFSSPPRVFKDSETEAYYADPYTSRERGSNEVHNRMIRRAFPKHESLDEATPSRVRSSQETLNHLPRRMLGYRTQAECFEREFKALHRKTSRQA